MEYRQPYPLDYCYGYSAGGSFYIYPKRRQMCSSIAIRPGYSADGCTNFTLGIDTRRILLLLSLRRRDRPNKVEFGFGVCELLGVFDLQVPVFVGYDVQGEDRFAVPLNSD